MSDLRRPPVSRREDPGEAWTEETLAPLRRLQIRCEIAPAVMARVAEARARRAVPVVFVWPRLIWSLSATAGLVSFASLAASLVRLVKGGQGTAEIRALAGSIGHLILFGWSQAGRVAAGLSPVGGAVIRTSLALLQAMTPILRGVGMLGAVAGALSILVSSYLFAHARRTAPQTGAPGLIQPYGGTR